MRLIHQSRKLSHAGVSGGPASCRRLLIASVLLLTPMTSGRLEAQQPDAFAEQILISEIGLVVDLADVLSAQELERLQPEDLLVLEDGKTRRVTRIEPVAGGRSAPAAAPGDERDECPWRLVFYIDEALAGAATMVDAALALGQRTDRLAELGCVDLVVADPAPRVVVDGSRDARQLEKVLVDIATAAREERDQEPLLAEFPQPSRDWRDRRLIRAQWDRLINFLAGRGAGGPRALILMTDGFHLSARDLEVLSGRSPRAPAAPDGSGLADIVVDTAQALASYGWLTIPLTIREESREPREAAADEFERWREMAAGRQVRAGERRTVVNFFGTSRPGRDTSALDDRLFEAYLLPGLAPLRALAEATAGDMVWREEHLDEVLEALGGRWRIWFQSSEPHDGRIRRLRVRLAERELYPRAPWWKRSSTPHLVAESRLRRLLAGETVPRGLDVGADIVRPEPGDSPGGARETLRIRVPPVAFEQGASIGHVRISIGFADSAGAVSFRHEIDYDAPPLGGAWEYALPLAAPPGTERLAVGVEDLSLEVWGATLLPYRTGAPADG